MIVIVASSFSFYKRIQKLRFFDCGKALIIPILNLSNSRGLKQCPRKKWIEWVSAVSIGSKFGRYGGSFAHSDNSHYYINFFTYINCGAVASRWNLRQPPFYIKNNYLVCLVETERIELLTSWIWLTISEQPMTKRNFTKFTLYFTI